MSRSTALFFCLLLLALGAPAAGAYTPAGTGGPLALAAAGMSMDQAVKMTEKRYHARVVKAETQKDGGRTVYVLRLLNESGHVWTVRVDAASGALL